MTTLSETRGLSPSERRVLDEAVRGLTVRQISERLVLTEATVKTHLSHIYAKLGVRGRVDLLARLRRDAADPPVTRTPPSASPDTPSPRHQRAFYRPWMVPVGLIAVSASILAFAVLVALSGTQRAASLDTVLRHVDAGAVSGLELHGDILIAYLDDGQSLEVRGVQREDVAGVAADAGVPLVLTQPQSVNPLLPYVFNLAGYALLAGVVWLLIRVAVRRQSAA